MHIESTVKWPGIVEAARDCRLFSLSTHREMGVILDKGGNRIAVAEGDETGVAYEDIDQDALIGACILHSHPNSSSLSAQDLWMTAVNRAKVGAVIAIDGSFYSSSGLTNTSYIDSMNWALQTSSRDLHDLWGWDSDEAFAVTPHYFNLLWSKQGKVKDYQYHLGPEASRLHAKLLSWLEERGIPQ